MSAHFRQRPAISIFAFYFQVTSIILNRTGNTQRANNIDYRIIKKSSPKLFGQINSSTRVNSLNFNISGCISMNINFIMFSYYYIMTGASGD